MSNIMLVASKGNDDLYFAKQISTEFVLMIVVGENRTFFVGLEELNNPLSPKGIEKIDLNDEEVPYEVRLMIEVSEQTARVLCLCID